MQNQKTTQNPHEKIIIALDYPNADAALEFVSHLQNKPVKLKIGMELFTSVGPSIVKAITDMGYYVFLDLKFKDIPNTAAGASRAAANMGVDMFNVHIDGGYEMMNAAKSAAVAINPAAQVIGVSELTSLDDDDMLMLGRNNVKRSVYRLAHLARAAGLDGIVSSPKEVIAARYILGPDKVIVTPGIQPEFAVKNADQKRVTTPGDAIKNGSDMLVIGRAITKADNPTMAIDMVANEIENAMPKFASNELDKATKNELISGMENWNNVIRQINLERASKQK